MYVSLLLGLPGLLVYGLALVVRERGTLRNFSRAEMGPAAGAKDQQITSPLPQAGGRPGVRATALGTTSKFTAAQYGLLLYMLFTILYVCLVGNMFENSENNRFRFNTEGFYVVLLGRFVYRVPLAWYRRRWGKENPTCHGSRVGDRCSFFA